MIEIPGWAITSVSVLIVGFGVIAATAAALAGAFVFVGWMLRMTGQWRILFLAVAVRLHGRNYREELLWKAMKERAGTSAWGAMNMARFVLLQHEGLADMVESIDQRMHEEFHGHD
ncbi:MAG: hypothetical protein WDA70_03695 [Lysobacteraceae bacterium]